MPAYRPDDDERITRWTWKEWLLAILIVTLFFGGLYFQAHFTPATN